MDGYLVILICGLLCSTSALVIEGSSKRDLSVALEDHSKTTLLSRSDCGIVKETPKIYGGKAAQLGEFPWTVGIQYKSKDEGEFSERFTCLGSLINKRYVLTTANCVSIKHLTPVIVVLGEWNLKTNPDCINKDCADPVLKVNVQDVIPHENYALKTNENDIGLIRLDQDVTFTDFISPICLPPKKLPFLELCEFVRVVGWGQTENGTRSDTLLKVDLPVTSTEECSQKLKTEIGENLFCAGGELGKDSCSGDAGSPAIQIFGDKANEARWYQYGIVAAGAGCGNAGYSGIYTKVEKYMDWIIAAIVKNDAQYSKQ